MQWPKLGLNCVVITLLIVISLLRGGKQPEDSVVGTVRCSALDWGLFGALQAICLLFFLMAYCLVRKEFAEKEECGY